MEAGIVSDSGHHNHRRKIHALDSGGSDIKRPENGRPVLDNPNRCGVVQICSGDISALAADVAALEAKSPHTGDSNNTLGFCVSDTLGHHLTPPSLGLDLDVAVGLDA
ncbi:hypothetical protein RRG08_010074 [Elysia crispata]|uniref:Uncharacterized protein n=1 Tax=Elysia crispata TaxID=231223 RepID=A0AAE1EBG4_9GAST|nr:hypothetical protein RRG08_010074 [Elysia crispata]